MEFNEKTLEDIIWENSQTPEGRKLLSDRGLLVCGSVYRQVDFGSYGRADLITVQYDPSINIVVITVFELKKGCISINALMQASRYVTALKRHGFNNNDFDYDVEYNICLIGDSFDDKSDFAFLYNETNDVEIYTYEFRLTGIFFNEVGKNWSHTNEKTNDETIHRITEDIENQVKELVGDDLSK